MTSVSAGALHSMALVGSSGEVWTWGWNGAGQLGDGTNVTRLSTVKLRAGRSQIAAGAYHSLALEDIQVLAWGWNAVGQLGDGTITSRLTPSPVPGAADLTLLSAGLVHSAGV